MGRLLLGRLVFMLRSEKASPRKYSTVQQENNHHVKGKTLVPGGLASIVRVFCA